MGWSRSGSGSSKRSFRSECFGTGHFFNTCRAVRRRKRHENSKASVKRSLLKGLRALKVKEVIPKRSCRERQKLRMPFHSLQLSSAVVFLVSWLWLWLWPALVRWLQIQFCKSLGAGK